MLSDTIAIMKGGQLAAAGSSLELKSAYGAGYNLHILTGGVPPGCQATGALLRACICITTIFPLHQCTTLHLSHAVDDPLSGTHAACGRCRTAGAGDPERRGRQPTMPCGL